MKKHLLALALLVTGSSFVAQADNKALDGYYRIQNVRDNKFVRVTGAFTARPDQPQEAVSTQPGSIFYINAAQATDSRGEQAFRIYSLRSQGIDVVGNPYYSYKEFLNDITTDGNFQFSSNLFHSMAYLGQVHGYTNVARATLEMAIYMVGDYINNPRYNKSSHDLKQLTEEFLVKVADNLNFNLYLQPSTNGSVKLYYDIPNLNSVSQWYLDPENKERFEAGFDALRNFLTERGVNTGETLDHKEVAEMAANGYVLPDEYRKNVNSQGMYVVKYQQLFADPELLFAWLKLNAIKVLDPERCPKITLKGLYLPDLAKELASHRVTAQLVSYLPRLNPDRRIFLISGLLSNGTEGEYGKIYTSNGEFGFIGQASSEKREAGDADLWRVIPVDNHNQYFKITIPSNSIEYIHNPSAENVSNATEIAKRLSEQGHYRSLFLDFPVHNPHGMRLYTLTNEKAPYNPGSHHMSDSPYPAIMTVPTRHQVYYYELKHIHDHSVAAGTPFIAVAHPDYWHADHRHDEYRLEIDYNTLRPNFTLRPGFNISDDEAAIGQKTTTPYSDATAVDDANDVTSVFRGVYLGKTTALLPYYGFGDYHETARPIYRLVVTYQGGNRRKFVKDVDGVDDNEAFLSAPLGFNIPSGQRDIVFIGSPMVDYTTGIEDVDVDNSDNSRRQIFDIYGRQVTNPVPGQLYIINGEKVIYK